VVSTNGRMGQYVSEGAGSGVIVSEDGYIVTNNHVIEGASKITVRLNNGAEYIATLVGRDSKTDLAVVKIDETELNSVVFGDSDELIVGELAVAIGNPLGELGGTVTEGIISALDRSIEIDGESMTLLQTSAAINPGNSGGGLFNQYGELIGIVNAKSSGSGIEGLGFAIPINTAEDIIEQIIEYGYVQGRIDLGVTFIDISDSMTALRYRLTSTGVYVQSIDSSTSTTTTNASANLKVGDRIISIDGVEVDTAAEIKVLLEDYKVGDQLIIQVERNRQTVDIRMVLKQANSI
ncbi:MAG: trypsin-like peptidase domain-containing protein, partial [Vallitaleaceae bacterium]|nr:trypsin-like peptidase domain-containing protein [Vallitaleaceae bacterium]